MSIMDLGQSLMVAGTTLLTSRAGLFLRVLLASIAYVTVTAVGRRLLPPEHRAWVHIGASLALLAALATPLFAAMAAAYFLAFYALVERMPRGPARRAAIIVTIVLQMIAPIWWLPALPGATGVVRELIAFTTNMTQLRCWSYAWDRSHEDTPAPGLRDYLLYMTFFPSFVGGPLLSFAEFQAGRLGWHWNALAPRLGEAFTIERRAWLRIALGGAAAIAVVQFASVLGPAAYTSATRGALPAWSHAVAVYLAVYLGFSAWSEVAIGSGRLAGVILPENFDYAHRSYGVADFWRRWNIRLGWWMRQYIYLPLGGSRRQLWRNTAAVFLATAVYHHLGGLKLIGPTPLLWPGFYVGWLGWAVLNTVGTLATRKLHRPTSIGPSEVAVIVATLLFSCVALQTAFLPAGLAEKLVDIYRALCFVPVRP